MMLRDFFPNVCIIDIDNRIKNGTITAGEILDLYKGKEWQIVRPCEDHHGCEFLLTSYDIIQNTGNKIKRMLARDYYIDFCGCLVITV